MAAANSGDSLVLNGVIELLGGGVASTQPGCEGAIFRLGKDFDLSAPQMTSEHVAGLLLAGEQVTQLRASNRQPKIPVVIIVPSTGDLVADRLTLSAARELLLQSTAQERWSMVWTRAGGLPITFDCMGLSAIVVNHSLIYHRNLCSLLEIDFEALPYGRSDDDELIVYPAPSQIWDAPPAPVTLDAMTTATNFLTGDASTFEVGIANWLAVTNCSILRTTATAHSGTASLRLTATAAATMTAKVCSDSAISDTQAAVGLGLKCIPGDTITVKGWMRAGTTLRTCNMGAQFFDSAGVAVGSPTFGTNVSDAVGSYTLITGTLTAPVGAAYAQARVQVQSPVIGETHDLDDVSIDRGAVYSADDGQTWSLSTTTAVTSQNSAKWSRVLGDAPIYDHTLPAAVDITGRAKLTFWLGLATTVSGYAQWHKGTVSVSVILYDPQGDSIEFGAKQVKVAASALISKPHWQLVNMHVPQSIPGFDYTQVVRYSIQVWSHWNRTVPQPELRATAYLCSIVAAPTATGSPVTRGSWYTLPGIVGTARAPLAVQLQPGVSSFSTVVEFTTTGSNNWTSSVGQTKIDKVETWGAGGGGSGRGSASPQWGGGGGGGGGYAMKRNVPVTASTLYHPFVGTGGNGGAIANQGSAGGDSWFTGDSGNTTRANGGRPGWAGVTWGGSKGGAETSDADLSYAGGDGHQSNANQDNFGGGGGSSAGTGSGGGHPTGRAGASPKTGGGPGGDGGFASGGSATGQTPATGPGGGGGGGADNNGGAAGAAGANGKVRLTYGASGIVPLASALVHMPGRDAHPQLSPLCSVGAGADTPNGATDYTVPPVGALVARFNGSYSIYLIANTFANGSTSRTVTVTIKQFAFSGGTSITQALSRTFIPNTDIVNGYIEMGVVTLPLAEISHGNTDSYFAVSVNSGQTGDRYFDVLFLDTEGQTVLLNTTGTPFANNVWLDVAELDRDMGGIYASDTDRDRARSWLGYADPNSTRISGGPLSVVPNGHNRMLVYAQQGNPSISVSYFPHWWQDRLS